MIKISATGKVFSISPVLTVGPNAFQKRELIIDDSYTKEGKTYPNYMCLDFSGERMALLDQFQPGQLVTVEGFLKGNFVTDSKGQQRIFHNVKGMSVVPYQTQSQPQAYVNPVNGAQYPTMQQPPRQNYQQPQAYQQQGQYHQPAGYNNPQTGLPFD